MHWPKISEKKKRELESLKESIKSSPARFKKSPKSIMASEAAYGTADQISMGARDNRANSENDDKGSATRKKIIWRDNPLKPKPQ